MVLSKWGTENIFWLTPNQFTLYKLLQFSQGPHNILQCRLNLPEYLECLKAKRKTKSNSPNGSSPLKEVKHIWALPSVHKIHGKFFVVENVYYIKWKKNTEWYLCSDYSYATFFLIYGQRLEERKQVTLQKCW